MNPRNSYKHYLLLILFLTLPFLVHAQEVLSGQELIEALQQGGYNLYFRHEATEWSQQDLVNKKDDWLSCNGNEIRQLSEQGLHRAQNTGEAMRRLNIPVNEVLASPYCRTVETARQLGLGEVQVSTAVINLRVADYFGGREAVILKAQKLLAQPPKAESNRVIVAHGNIAQAATPVYPGEGEAVIFKPDGNGHFVFVGRITPEQWVQLSQGN